MNKYQKAFEIIGSIIIYPEPKQRDDGWIEHTHADIKNSKEFEIIEELVDKSIPLKPIHIGKFIFCPICKEHGFGLWDDAIPNENDAYCGRCGQKIDWSDYEEQ